MSWGKAHEKPVWCPRLWAGSEVGRGAGGSGGQGWEFPPLLALEKALAPHVSRRAAAMRPSEAHQQGCFHMAFVHFVMTVWFVAIYCPASLSPLFISHGSCTAVNHHRAIVQFPAINSDAGKGDLCIPVPLFFECL